MKDNSIKAGELRCGNWVMIKEHFYTGRVTCIDIENGIVKTDVEEFYEPLTFDDIEPIPLTAVALEKCGFEYINLPSNFNGGNGGYRKLIMSSAQRYILLTGRSHFICGMYDSDDVKYYSPLTDFSYMHQLQNMYFALTGKELEITL